MLKRLLGWAGTTLALAVAGCGDGPATLAGTWRSPAAWSSLVYATSHGPLLVEVHGAPFGGPAPAFRAAIAAAMTDRVFGRATAFTPDPLAAPQPRFRVVLAFNAAPDTNAHALCQGQVATAAPNAGPRVTVHGAFCDGTTLLASIQGWVANVSGPDDRRFRQLLGQLTRELFGTPP